MIIIKDLEAIQKTNELKKIEVKVTFESVTVLIIIGVIDYPLLSTTQVSAFEGSSVIIEADKVTDNLLF